MSTFNNNFFDPFLEVLRNVLRPVIFSDNLSNLLLEIADIFTPSSNYNALRAEQEIDIVWGRHGNDSLIDFAPGAEQSGQRQIDIFFGDFVDEEIYELLGFVGEDLERTPRDWKDRFILGDWQQPYYVDDPPFIFGLNQFAVIADFSPSQDLIQLHGTPQDYHLVSSPLGTAIFWQQGTVPDLIALLPGVSGLSLEGDSFEFQGDTPPPGPVLEEAQQIGTAGIDFLFGSTVDPEGNVYVGGGTGGSLAGANLGPRDAWLAKFDSNGNQLWSTQFGTAEIENSWAIANDGSNIYVVGETSGDLANTNQGGRDVYLAKFDSDGNQLWLKQFGSSSFDQPFSVNIDSGGNIYISGYTGGDLGGPNNNRGQNFLNSTEANHSTLVQTTDSYVTKFDSDGNQLWIKQFGTDELEDNYGLAIDKDDNIFSGGTTLGDFGGESAGLYDGWLVKLDSDGKQLWTQQFGTPDYEFLWDLDTDSEGNVYATGWTLGDLGGENAGSYDAWVTKYDRNGNQVWIEQFGTGGDDASYFDGIEVDSNDNIFLTGYTDSDLGGPNAGSYDAWVAKYDSDGKQLWLQQFGTPDYDVGITVTADSAGSLYVAGLTEGSLGDTNNGSVDGWVAKLDAESGTLQDFSGDAFDSLGVEESNFSDLIEFPTTDALTSLTTGLTQTVADPAETLIGDDPLTDSMNSVLTPSLDFFA